jgi:hypothetical protein
MPAVGETAFQDQAQAKPRPRISLAGRKRIAAAQRKRWSEYHKAKKKGKAKV